MSPCPSVGVVTAIGLLGLALQASYQRGLVPAVLVSAALAPLMNAKQATESDAESVASESTPSTHRMACGGARCPDALGLWHATSMHMHEHEKIR